jgi:vacuolar-type H+-ATPase subunit B/Vma2
MKTLELVYEKLSIPGFQKMKPKAEKYLESVKNFEKNKFQLDENEVKTVKEKLDFAYKEWGY